MSEMIKAGLKPAPLVTKSAVVGKSPKDFPGIKKLSGSSLVNISPKLDETSQLRPPLALKSQVIKTGLSELKSQSPPKLAVNVKTDTVKKVGIDAPKVGISKKGDADMKQGPPKMLESNDNLSKSSIPVEKSSVTKSVNLLEPAKSDLKSVPKVKFQAPVLDSPSLSEFKIEQKFESQLKEPSLTKHFEPKPSITPTEQGKGTSLSPNKPKLPDTSSSRVQNSQESSYSKNSINSANVNIPNNNFQNVILPQTGAFMNGIPNMFDKSGSPNFQGLDPAMWQMITTIAAICSTACQNSGRSRSRHCCRKHHSRKHKKETELKDVNSNSSNKDSSDLNETQPDQTSKESANDESKKTGERKSNQNDNTVSGTKWHGIEKKIATIRGLRDLDDTDSNFEDDEFAASDALSRGIGQPRYSNATEFPNEISAFNGHSRNRRYLAKQGVCTGPKFSKSPFVGGLSAARRRPYSSLTEMAAYFSNIEPQDQNDVIVMLLACRKLEKQIEEQQVVMQLLEHDLKEAQSLLRFPPEWRSLSNSEVLGHSPLPTGQIPSTNDPPYVSNHPNIEPPWVNKRPKDGLPSRAPTKL